MNANAIALGVNRGWITWRSTNSSREGLFNLFFYNAIPLVFLIVSRDSTLPGTDIALGAKLLPGMLALMVVFSVMGTAYYLSTEREDGTLLRAKAVPRGMSAYVVGLAFVAVMDVLVSLAIVLVPGMFIVPDVPVGDVGMWIGLIGYVVLGLIACLPLGVLIGSAIQSPRVIGGFGFLITMGLAMVSGLFFPMQDLWGWVQVLVQALPLYWLGLGMRSVFLPDAAAAYELTESWRTLETLGVLGAWAALGLIAGPILLRRTARRESGAAMEARRAQAMQRT
ncbi:ABC transporter permease [Actinokineospora sp. UTMC 2448]|uniref:ABC transporter permease n=1 Tax=Actinokineospora sp. UTMC 2448 TaxID=2268449 RepID=UPI0021649218|nr:ABC transporter permease [Actinokineospora sp. UTMC 2448]UVS77364.1 ABC-2 family transporter protein [Actinokineospora sp. UTMC 2448]